MKENIIGYFIHYSTFKELFKFNSFEFMSEPDVHSLVFDSTNYALYAYTKDKKIAKRFESERKNIFVKMKLSEEAITDSGNTHCELTNFKGSTISMNNTDKNLSDISILMTWNEINFIYSSFCGELNELKAALEAEYSDEFYMLKEKYQRALNRLDFNTIYQYADMVGNNIKGRDLDMDLFKTFKYVYGNTMRW